MARLDAAVWDLWLADEQYGGVEVHGHALAIARHVRSLLDNATYTGVTGRDLQRVHGQALELAGWTAMDAGEPTTARSLFNAALTSAQLGEDPGLTAYVLAQMSSHATIFLSAREGVELAVLATKVAGAVATDLFLSDLAGKEALGHARRGDAAAFSAAMSRADQLHREYEASRDASWLSYWDQSELRYATAQGHLYLGSTNAAVKASEEAIYLNATVLPGRPCSRHLACRADALLASGAIDEGAVAVADAATQAKEVKSDRLRSRLIAMGTILQAHPSVSGVQHALDTLRPLTRSRA